MPLRPVVHLVLHFAAPAVLAALLWPKRWRSAWLVMLAAIAIDLDHLWAVPIYDADRCSLAVHTLHQPWAIGIYAALLLPRSSRWLAAGLLLHIALDGLDCLWMMST